MSKKWILKNDPFERQAEALWALANSVRDIAKAISEKEARVSRTHDEITKLIRPILKQVVADQQRRSKKDHELTRESRRIHKKLKLKFRDVRRP